MFKARATISSEPMLDICRIISSVRMGEITVAKIVKPPSIIRTAKLDNITPKPNVAARGIAVMQSISDFE